MRLMRLLNNLGKYNLVIPGLFGIIGVFWKIVGLFEISGTLWIIINETFLAIKTLKTV